MRGQISGWTAWLCFCLFAAAGFVSAAAPYPIPEATSLLVDQVGALNDAEREALAARLQAIQMSNRAQIAILVSSGTGDAPLADYASRSSDWHPRSRTRMSRRTVTAAAIASSSWSTRT